MSEEHCCGLLSRNVGPHHLSLQHELNRHGSDQRLRLWRTTGLILMVNEGVKKLGDECLGSVVEEYECLGFAVVLVTMMLMHFIECESSSAVRGRPYTAMVTITPPIWWN
ncbi:high-affinity Zn(2+) transporter zrt1 [Phytophthora pseudosyringae]|uniref:High-affinity Zn(2+) transporter zrt1 n=1 Tax=Phytophthora pseudosyringae TaxID=221518 RepID=A0A8T1W3I2_9STRA|nr:high-affinity Zn(2+) transporter zrt1 [Phytophthora pseudosyringae]